MTPTRLRIRSAQQLIQQARGRTQLSRELVLETADRILTFQLHSPGLVLDTWTLYQVMVTPQRSRLSNRRRPSPTT